MTASTLERRAGGGGGIRARRAVMRWALRMFRREWRQQLLMLGMIVIAVAATVIGGLPRGSSRLRFLRQAGVRGKLAKATSRSPFMYLLGKASSEYYAVPTPSQN